MNAQDMRQANRYAYVGGDPINLTDPTGLHVWDVIKTGAKVFVGVGAFNYTYEALTDEEDDIEDEVCDLNDAFNPVSGPVSDLVGCE